MPPKGEVWWRRRDVREDRDVVHFVSNFSDQTSVCGYSLEGPVLFVEPVTCAACLLQATSTNTTGTHKMDEKGVRSHD